MRLKKELNLTSTDKLPTWISDKKALKPLSGKQKYSNAHLFDTRETEMKLREEEEEMKKELKTRNKSLKQIKTTPSSNLYLTDTHYTIERNCNKTNGGFSTTTNVNYAISTKPTSAAHHTSKLGLLKQIGEKRQQSIDKDHKEIRVPLLGKKTNAIVNAKKECVRDFIDKTREIVLMKYSANIKKESAVRLQETYENELEMIKESINSMEEAKKLFNDNFINHFNEYVRFLIVQREQEKNTDNLLVDIIMKLQMDIQSLDYKKRKMESDKALYARWLFLQIQIKEKILELPPHYTIFIELGDTTFTRFLGKQSTKTILTELKKTSVRRVSNVQLMNITNEERQRILQYKRIPAFETPDELYNEFKRLEEKNIKLIETYNNERIELRELTLEKEKLNNEESKVKDIITKETSTMEKALMSTKVKHAQLLRDKLQLINCKNVISKEKKKRSTSFDNLLMTMIPGASSLHKDIPSKILFLYKSIKDYLPQETEGNVPTVNEENELLDMLAYIESNHNKLIASYESYCKGPRATEAIRIKSRLDKEHNRAKANYQLQKQQLKMEKLKEKIQSRNGKIFFLPKRKIETNYGRFVKKEDKNIGKGQKCSQLTLQDFLFDISIDPSTDQA